jgi:ubiquitin-protein ligase
VGKLISCIWQATAASITSGSVDMGPYVLHGLEGRLRDASLNGKVSQCRHECEGGNISGRMAASREGARLFRRLRKEISMLKADNTTQVEGIKIFTHSKSLPEEDSSCVWHALVAGPVGSLYENLAYWIEIRFPVDYPASSMQMRFLTPCEHPNVMISTGEICADIFHRAAGQCDGGWSAMMVTYTILLCVRSLLDDPNPDSPLNMRLAQAYTLMKSETSAAAREHMRTQLQRLVAQVHASAPRRWAPTPEEATFRDDAFVIADFCE